MAAIDKNENIEDGSTRARELAKYPLYALKAALEIKSSLGNQ